jgi:hypothetical protein
MPVGEHRPLVANLRRHIQPRQLTNFASKLLVKVRQDSVLLCARIYAQNFAELQPNLWSGESHLSVEGAEELGENSALTKVEGLMGQIHRRS